MEAISALTRLQDARVAALLAGLLGAKHADVRRAAAKAIGELGTAGAVEALADRSLRDEDRNVRLAAIGALGQSEDPRAAQALISSLHDPDKDVRLAVISAVRRSADPEVENELLRALADSVHDVRRAAAIALVRRRGRA